MTTNTNQVPQDGPERLRYAADLLDYFEDYGEGCALISDDDGRWAVVCDGFQTMPSGLPQHVEAAFIVAAGDWKPSVREALQAFYDDTAPDPRSEHDD